MWYAQHQLVLNQLEASAFERSIKDLKGGNTLSDTEYHMHNITGLK
jgi:hypothetical protein